jgi:hypothetical protein
LKCLLLDLCDLKIEIMFDSPIIVQLMAKVVNVVNGLLKLLKIVGARLIPKACVTIGHRRFGSLKLSSRKQQCANR